MSQCHGASTNFPDSHAVRLNHQYLLACPSYYILYP